MSPTRKLHLEAVRTAAATGHIEDRDLVSEIRDSMYRAAAVFLYEGEVSSEFIEASEELRFASDLSRAFAGRLSAQKIHD